MSARYIKIAVTVKIVEHVLASLNIQNWLGNRGKGSFKF
jgi:hypothetical protein